MSDLRKLIKAIEQRDADQVRSILEQHNELVHERDEIGATALHHAAFDGNREIVELLLDKGAEINSIDGKFSATPAGWAIEYLREKGAYLGIELRDFAYAIETGDVRWVARLLDRFPGLRQATSTDGKPFRQLAAESGKREVIALFQTRATK
ncbi:MAG: ankyrin repeat domain-containing protein [Candidatus Acidiferrum sp.]